MMAQPSTRTVLVVIILLAALTCTLFSLACIGHDATIAALTITAILISGFGILMLTFFITDKKNARQAAAAVVLNTVRPNPLEQFPMGPLPPLPPYPAIVPPFPMPPPPQIVTEAPTVVIQPPVAICPPSYTESADIEDRRVTDSSNAPPAYNLTDTVSDNNIASFSPPPYYSPPSPFFGTSVQTTTLYLSGEDMSVSPVPTSPIPQTQMRAPSPVRRHPARKLRRQSPRLPKPEQVSIAIEDDQSGASTSTATPKTPTRTSLPQMFIDCSKAEPTLFTINGEESII